MATFLALFIALPAESHSTNESPVTAAAPAAVEVVVGTVEELVIEDRVNNTTRSSYGLHLDDGTTVPLTGAGAEALQSNARVVVRGQPNGAQFAVHEVQQLSPLSRSDVAARVANATQVEGTLTIAHADDFATGRSQYLYHVHDDAGGVTTLSVSVLPPELRGGMRIIVSGRRDVAAGSLYPQHITILTAPAQSTELKSGLAQNAAITNSVLVILANFNNTAPPSYTAAQAQQVMVTNSGSVANYYNEVSYGQQLLNVTVTSGWVAMNLAATCDYNSIGSAANAAALAANPAYNAANYNFVVYLFPAQSCGWLGLAYVGFPHLAWINGTGAFSTGTIAHEMGHNFGLLHAGSLNCGSASIGGTCNVAEYGDPWDTMGNQRAMHFNAAQKSLLNWIPSSSVKTHTSGSASYTLNPIESPGGSVYAIKIPTAKASRTYWVEFRQPLGFDAPLASYPNNGAQIRVASPFEWSSGVDDTEIVDMTPGTPGTFTDSALLVGQSYVDSTYGINIIVTGASASALTVSVTTASGAVTTTTLASSANPSTIGTNVAFTATIAGTNPTGSINFKDGATSIAACSAVALTGSGNSRTAACTTNTLAAGAHSVVATYSGDTANAPSSSAALSQTVNKALSTTGIATSLTPAAAGTSVTFTATVSGTAPTGTVNFKDGAASITGCSAAALAGSGNIRTATCATSSLSVATHSISAVYSGDATNSGSTSTTLSQVINNNISQTTVWVEDAVPLGATLVGQGDSWNWMSSNPAPYSGALAHQSALLSGMHQHYFYNATTKLAIAVGDTLFTYVYLDPANPPSEVVLQWNDGSWEHRAYWGANLITSWGVDGTNSRRYMGPLPAVGQWARLAVPAAQVGLEGSTLNGMAFSLYDGRATWDYAGKAAAAPTTYQVSGTVTLSGAARSGVSFTATGGVSCTSSDASGNYACTVPQGWTGTVTPSLSGYSFTPSSRSYSSVAANQTAQNYTAATNAGAAVWVEDAVPAGAAVASDGGDAWTWISANPAPFSGTLAHQSALHSGMHQHYFYNATTKLAVAVGDTLFAYVYLDPANPPSEVMLQWYDANWEHRAYWGANLITSWGVDGTNSRRYMGPLPAVGQWVRLAVPAAQVGLEGHTLSGMAYTLYNGRATWDYAGK